MNNFYKALLIIITLSTICTAVYRFDVCKVAKADFKILAADYGNYKDIQYRRELNQRIWDIKRNFPNTYQNMQEYHKLVEELRLLEMKINAYLQRSN